MRKKISIPAAVNSLAGPAQLTLRTLINIGEGSNISALKGLAGLILLVLQRCQDAKQYRQEYEFLRQKVYELAVVLVSSLQESHLDESESQRQNIERTCKSFDNIVATLEPIGKKRWRLTQWILRQEEGVAILQDCLKQVDHALETFKIVAKLTMEQDINQHRIGQSVRYEEVMQLMTDSHKERLIALSRLRAAICENREESRNATVVSLVLPSSPTYFFGRDKELHNLVEGLVGSDPTYVAILGPGGIGKTSLLLKALHDSRVANVYGSSRFFIRCDSATSSDGLLTLIANTLGIEGEYVKEQVMRVLGEFTRVVVCLDNLESPWEPETSKSKVEGLLQSLTTLPSLTLLVSLRGAERPGSVRWTLPITPPLEKLALSAAREAFFAYADHVWHEPETISQIDRLLTAVDCVPLAISLLGNVAQWDPIPSLIRMWETESTSFYQRTSDRTGNLEVSIQLSLNSARMKPIPEAQELLSILSLLPDGIKEQNVDDLFPHLRNVHKALSVLKQTSLAYDEGEDLGGRIRVLAPVRAYVLRHHRPHPVLRGRLDNYYASLAQLSSQVGRSNGRAAVQMLMPEIGNLHSVIGSALRAYIKGETGSASLAALIDAAVKLSRFQRTVSFGSTKTLEASLAAARKSGDKKLEGLVTLEMSRLLWALKNGNPESRPLCDAAFSLFQELGDEYNSADCLFFLGNLTRSKGSVHGALGYLEQALTLSVRSQNEPCQAKCLAKMSELSTNNGQMQEARRQSTEALHIFHRLDDCLNIAYSTYWLGQIAQQCSAFTAAVTYFEKATHYFEQAGDELNMARPLISIGDLHCFRSDFREAVEAQDKALTILRRYNRLKPNLWGYALINMANALGGLYEEEAANGFLQQAIQVFNERNSVHGKIVCNIIAGDLAFNKNAFDEAWKYYHPAALRCVKIPLLDEQAECRFKLGRLAHSQQFLQEALRQCVVAFSIYRNLGAVHGQAMCMQKLGDIFLDEGDVNTAEATYHTAIIPLQQLGARRVVADCHLGLGKAALKRRASDEAAVQLQTARAIYLETGDTRGVVECDKVVADPGPV